MIKEGGVPLYRPRVELTFDGKKCIVQNISINKDKYPTTRILVVGIITNEPANAVTEGECSPRLKTSGLL